MVVKRVYHECKRHSMFESSVISYGSQTLTQYSSISKMFESSVISYGSQTTACV